ncbi:replication protein A 32 kDa subunit A-like isoform X1 [Gossypium australe]|uniref:Replication protein A 32 kDa subunit A-like isoform X1 n=1 Tax=Gossypium australe TaxID=47621 RepID=A0A5B6XA81_9ROSI|nr:replication protein A 32 kDa subunit A-like isoform X1 [Gossypium australe]
MFSSSQFDAATAFSGGGFMPSQFVNSTPSQDKQSRDTQGLLSATVKQISEASQSGDEKPNFKIDGVHVNNVKVVGMLFNKNVRSSDVRFELDDGTGRIECIRWVTESADAREMDAIDGDGTYVRVIGHLQNFQGKKQLNAFSVSFFGFLDILRPVTNFDEITCHFIECIHYHLQNSKVQLEGGAPAQPQMANSSFSTPVRGASNVYQPASVNDVSVQYNTDGFKGFDKLVLNYLQQPSNIDREIGVHVNELSQHLKAPVEKIKDAIEFLEREGLVYSSIDDYHYKAVEGC